MTLFQLYGKPPPSKYGIKYYQRPKGDSFPSQPSWPGLYGMDINNVIPWLKSLREEVKPMECVYLQWDRFLYHLSLKVRPELQGKPVVLLFGCWEFLPAIDEASVITITKTEYRNLIKSCGSDPVLRRAVDFARRLYSSTSLYEWKGDTAVKKDLTMPRVLHYQRKMPVLTDENGAALLQMQDSIRTVAFGGKGHNYVHISGPPGTGKTTALEWCLDKVCQADFWISLGAQPRVAWCVCTESTTPEGIFAKLTDICDCSNMNDLGKKLSCDRPPVFLYCVLDEMDQAEGLPTILHRLSSWCENENYYFALIGLSNSMDRISSVIKVSSLFLCHTVHVSDFSHNFLHFNHFTSPHTTSQCPNTGRKIYGRFWNKERLPSTFNPMLFGLCAREMPEETETQGLPLVTCNALRQHGRPPINLD